MKILSRVGLGLFLIGFGLWLYTLTLNTFILTPEILKKSLKPEHQSTLGIRLQPMLNKTYSSGRAFSYAFDQTLNGLNAEYKAAQQWDKVIYDEYSFAITKAAAQGPLKQHPFRWFFLTFGLAILGALLYILPELRLLPGIKNDRIFQQSSTSRGWIGWTVGTFLIGFYIVLYYFPQYLVNWTLLVDPLSKALNGGQASRWFLYGFLYTICVAVMGIRMLIKYRHSRYQQVRTLSVMFFQTAVAFIIPEILVSLNKPYYDFKNIWPLDYDFFFDYNLNSLIQSGGLGVFMLVWGILLFLIGVPIMTYFFGKRWYCSWVCGCGGLAETLGDPYRQLSDKSLKSWKIERYIVHGVLVFAVVMTVMVLYTYFTGSAQVAFIDSYSVRSAYGFWIGSIFAGVVGTGFYPLMGNRVWCRFGCPLAAYLGLWQRKKSRFRITTNGGQCISCGNCSTYCEMGIDVRAYAQRGQDIVRSSCVGCGICSAVCPRGVLNLENASERTRVMVAPEVMLGNDMKP
ncbi:4Fe-4S binding protein [Runella slithyformis]|uniref:4Fe-4S ferredoxin iron-sulfur binding domain-containing protein n=1 Tax=Runella slithyformis (strain ATCC 29530 / DSM 19594 / LMG 11500 / NCIMB 11436 / LSU 4) TaxID=761193 RepID=A0A7U4E4Z5_RUNSL|nr:4Fe-4S dicluster domain-containing protein [Runella slithyformis]AEI48041.1 4Fe-4S ferredoxin iron-sulfur binding domain-containing protein [Runella slithyformis DSM 19594]